VFTAACPWSVSRADGSCLLHYTHPVLYPSAYYPPIHYIYHKLPLIINYADYLFNAVNQITHEPDITLLSAWLEGRNNIWRRT